MKIGYARVSTADQTLALQKGALKAAGCSRINGADPFVIAMAHDGGARWTVVADEHPGSQENRKIPFVCNQEGIRCISFQQMMFAEGWKF